MRKLTVNVVRIAGMSVVALGVGIGIAYAAADLTGTSNGGSAADTINLQGADDRILLGDGSDTIDLGNGDDTLAFGAGNNAITASGSTLHFLFEFNFLGQPDADLLQYLPGTSTDDDQIVVRADDISIRANDTPSNEDGGDIVIEAGSEGDVVIRLGS